MITLEQYNDLGELSGIPLTVKCGNEHSLVIDAPPNLAVAQFHDFGQDGIIEIYGGQGPRPFYVEAWIHDSTFTTLPEIVSYLDELDELSGDLIKFELLQNSSPIYSRIECRFVGFHRKPFDGQRHPEPIPAIGVHDSNYGGFHICGELHFVELNAS